MSTLAPVLGLLAGVLGIAGTVPYVRDTLAGRTRPHRGTWGIWAALAIVVCVSQRADGASWSLVGAGVSAVLTTAVLLLAIGRGEGGLRPGELVVMAVAAAGVATWLLVDEPLAGTACVVAADGLGAAMMVPKILREPGSETLPTFVLASVAGALGAGAAGTLDASLLLYPAYYCLGNGALAVLIGVRRARPRSSDTAGPASTRAASAPRQLAAETEVSCASMLRDGSAGGAGLQNSCCAARPAAA